ncbi:hypothetical protein GCM10022275_11610 [Tessaracoccus defluvii]
MARYVFRTGNAFAVGHSMGLNGPIVLESDTLLRSIAFAPDPELPPVDSPNGRFEFLQVVGITEDEEKAITRWTGSDVLAVFGDRLPLYVTDLDRPSLMDDPEIARRIDEGSARNGSHTGAVFVEKLGWEKRKRLFRKGGHVVSVGARQAPEIGLLLPLRLPFGRQLLVAGGEQRVLFQPGDRGAVAEDGETLEVTLSPESVAMLSDLLVPRAGSYRIPGFDDLTIEVLVTGIKDQDGKVIERIG